MQTAVINCRATAAPMMRSMRASSRGICIQWGNAPPAVALAATAAIALFMGVTRRRVSLPEVLGLGSPYAVGDVAHEAFQRTSVAQGEGATAVLDFYYGRHGLYGRRLAVR